MIKLLKKAFGYRDTFPNSDTAQNMLNAFACSHLGSGLTVSPWYLSGLQEPACLTRSYCDGNIVPRQLPSAGISCN